MHTCVPVQTPVHLPDGTGVCIGRIEIQCEPPLVKVCSPSLPPIPVCRCEAPKALSCEARIEYLAEDPSTAVLSAPLPGCGATAEIAIAVALAKLLTMLR